jgi:hypothetical protein
MRIKTLKNKQSELRPFFTSSHFHDGFHLYTYTYAFNFGEKLTKGARLFLPEKAGGVEVPREYVAQVLRAWRKA